MDHGQRSASRHAVSPQSTPDLVTKCTQDTGLTDAELQGRCRSLSEHVVAVLLTLLAAFTRFYRLDQPAAVVFDEFHFGRFLNKYVTGRYLFDMHPPLAKLTFYAYALWFGYDPEECVYEHIHQPYSEDCQYLRLRGLTGAWAGVNVGAMMCLPFSTHLVGLSKRVYCHERCPLALLVLRVGWL